MIGRVVVLLGNALARLGEFSCRIGYGLAGRTRPILRRPAGAGAIPKSSMGWGVFGTTRDGILCELCGTVWPGDPSGEESIYIGNILGLQFVDECCGRLVDLLYEEFGSAFAIRHLQEFADNPGGSEFGYLRWVISDLLRRARQKLGETTRVVTDCQDAADGFSRQGPED